MLDSIVYRLIWHYQPYRSRIIIIKMNRSKGLAEKRDNLRKSLAKEQRQQHFKEVRLRSMAELYTTTAPTDLAQVKKLIGYLVEKRGWELTFPYAVQSIPALGENLDLIPEVLEGLKSYMDFDKNKLDLRSINEMMIELLRTIRAMAESVEISREIVSTDLVNELVQHLVDAQRRNDTKMTWAALNALFVAHHKAGAVGERLEAASQLILTIAVNSFEQVLLTAENMASALWWLSRPSLRPLREQTLRYSRRILDGLDGLNDQAFSFVLTSIDKGLVQLIVEEFPAKLERASALLSDPAELVRMRMIRFYQMLAELPRRSLPVFPLETVQHLVGALGRATASSQRLAGVALIFNSAVKEKLCQESMGFLLKNVPQFLKKEDDNEANAGRAIEQLLMAVSAESAKEILEQGLFQQLCEFYDRGRACPLLQLAEEILDY